MTSRSRACCTFCCGEPAGQLGVVWGQGLCLVCSHGAHGSLFESVAGRSAASRLQDAAGGGTTAGCIACHPCSYPPQKGYEEEETEHQPWDLIFNHEDGGGLLQGVSS